ncbi:ABC transporter permease [Paenibacillus sp. GCM10027626]|uniref:ABC transporter permease n=1 Tax=Paenibacillus sp. GCM10027626 TaxID=3273411 RepID=UPI00363EA4C7
MQKKPVITKSKLSLLLMALPFIVLVFLFNYLPLFGWVYVFFDYKPGIPLSQTPFVGLKFFELTLNDGGELLNVLKNTLAMSFLGLLTSPLPLIFAILLSEVKNKTFQKIVQTTTTLPNFISWFIVFSLFFSVFSVEGLFNTLLIKLHIISEPTNILGNGEAVWYVQTAVAVWKGLGWGAIIYLASIAGIDQELFDAAKVDGAGRFQTIMNVTVPGLMPTYIVLLLLSISNMLSNGFDQYFVFHNPLVAEKIEVLDYYVYRIGIATNDYAYATAIGMSKTVISVILLFTVNFISKRVRGQSIV